MAWEATYLLPLVLLVLLAAGSWEQQPELLQKLEGEEVSVRCDYPPQNSSKPKTWCRITTEGTCTSLVNHPRLGQEPGDPRFVIRDYPGQGYFTVTMAALAEKDSGLYWCGFYEYPQIDILRAIHLTVSPALTQASNVTAQVPPTIPGGKELSMPPTVALSELQVLAIVLTCGFVLNKGLVFSVLFILLRKARASDLLCWGVSGPPVKPLARPITLMVI
ncbi:PREDICTED: natural cytotoxicity triggering receptor 2-like [Myotis brandtii]|uniref:natural cytotoxicity triggering receptor 2-like n=1 Tax=Myotis brandtii TaxID=109478 RepID=UPI0007040A18|nr:PREDICTED: natural cytotoxicity triggering receptor 2-like [Myotis brandtii]